MQLWFLLLSVWERLPKKQFLVGSELSKSNILKHGKFQKTCLSIWFQDIRMWLTMLKLNQKIPKFFSFKWLKSNVTPESDLTSKVHIQSCKASSISAWNNQAGGGAEWLPGCNCALWPLKGPQDNPFLAAGGGSSNGHFLLPNPSYKLWLGLMVPCSFREIWRRLIRNGMGNTTSLLAGGMIQCKVVWSSHHPASTVITSHASKSDL